MLVLLTSPARGDARPTGTLRTQIGLTNLFDTQAPLRDYAVT